MFKALLITASVLLAAVVIRRTGILNTVKNAVFDKVNDLIGFEGTTKTTGSMDTSSVAGTPTYH